MALVGAGAGLLFGLAMVMLTVFFITKDERFDRVAEWSFVGFGVLAVIMILAVPAKLADAGLVGTVITAIGVGGAAIVGLGELGTTLKLVDFRRIATLLTIGFLAFLAWIGATSLLVLGGGALPPGLGWLGLVAIVVGIGLAGLIVRQPGVISGEVEPGAGLMTAFTVPMAAIVAWMVWLGLSL
jgi:hypothetical protein